MKRLVGITGYAQSGKSTVASVVKGYMGGDIISMADPLRAMMLEINPMLHVDQRKLPEAEDVSHDYLTLYNRFGYEACKMYTDLRMYMVALGKGAREHIGPDVWITAAEERMSHAVGNVIIPDIRYANEAALIQRQGGLLIHVVRHGIDAANEEESVNQELVGLCSRGHSYEVVHNGGDLWDLDAAVLEVLALNGYT